MQKEFWLDRWQNRQIGFHQQQVNEYLEKYWPEMSQSQPRRVFVPLCGKSIDMLWLAQQGNDVVGIEFSQDAIEEFFVENQLEFETAVFGNIKVYRSEKITLYQGDFFELEPEILGNISVVYDRASLVALPEERRGAYCSHLKRLTANADILLISMEYDQSMMAGPPFSVCESEIKKHYSAIYQVKLLETADLLSQSPRFKERGLQSMNEKVYKITPLTCN